MNKLTTVVSGRLMKETILVFVLFIIMSQKSVMKIQNNFLPESYYFYEEPKFVNIVINAIIAGIVFFLLNKFVIVN